MQILRKNRKILYLFVILIAGIFLSSCQPNKKSENKIARIPVKVSKVGIGTINKDITFTGTIRSKNQVDLFSKIPGRVSRVYYEEGDFVSKGNVVVQLDDSELRAQFNQAKAALQVALAQVSQASTSYNLTSSTTGIQVNVVDRTLIQTKEALAQARSNYKNASLDYKRMKELYKKGAIAKKALDQATTQYEVSQSRVGAAKAQVQQVKENLRLAQANTAQTQVRRSQLDVAYASVGQARANLQYIKANLDNTTIRSPIDGVVTLRNVEPGELVSPGDKKPFVIITDNRTVYLEAEIPESDFMGLDKGKKVKVTFDSLGKTFIGRIKTVISSADPRSRTFRIKVAIPNPRGLIKDGMSAVGKLTSRTYRGIVIPRSWIKIVDGDYYIVKPNSDGKAIQQKIEVSYINEKKVLVKDGLKTGDTVVSIGQGFVKDGDFLDIKNSGKLNVTRTSAFNSKKSNLAE